MGNTVGQGLLFGPVREKWLIKFGHVFPVAQEKNNPKLMRVTFNVFWRENGMRLSGWAKSPYSTWEITGENKAESLHSDSRVVEGFGYLYF